MQTAPPSPAVQAPSGERASAVAVVNGTVITWAAFMQRVLETQVHLMGQPAFDATSAEGKAALAELQTQVLDWMIDQILIEQAASAAGVAVTEQMIDAQVSRIRGNDAARFERWLKASGLTPESLREQVRMDLLTAAMRDQVTEALPRKAEHVRVRHILLSEESVGQEVLNEVAAGKDFVALARQYSEDQVTRGEGGDLGFLPWGVMPPAFDEAAFSLQAGQVSGLVRSQSGLHIIQVVERDAERAVEQADWPAVQQRAFEDWLAEIHARSDIQRYG